MRPVKAKNIRRVAQCREFDGDLHSTESFYETGSIGSKPVESMHFMPELLSDRSRNLPDGVPETLPTRSPTGSWALQEKAASVTSKGPTLTNPG